MSFSHRGSNVGPGPSPRLCRPKRGARATACFSRGSGSEPSYRPVHGEAAGVPEKHILWRLLVVFAEAPVAPARLLLHFPCGVSPQSPTSSGRMSDRVTLCQKTCPWLPVV